VKPTRFDDNLKRLRRELVKLEKAPGTPIARRNARARVLAAVRLLRAAVDREYQTIIVRTGVKRLKTFEGRVARMERAGWEQVATEYVTDYVEAGIKAKKITHGSSWGWFVPSWAVAIGRRNTAQLRAAKKSRALKRGALTAQALNQTVAQ